MIVDESEGVAVAPLSPELRRARDMVWFTMSLLGLTTREIAELGPHLDASQPQIARRTEEVRKRVADAAGTEDPRKILAMIARNMGGLRRGR